jgi:EmrB/QacA subfamily drug resistance transporter
MAFIDSTAVNVALPVLQASLATTLAGAQWVVESYALLLSSLILVGGSLGDRFGRERIFSLGVAWFALASIWCGAAPTIAQLVAARAFQGIGAALLVPGSLAIIGSRFPAERRGRAIGTWSAFTSLSAAAGPLLGGWMVEHVSWRVVFFINLPLALVVLLIMRGRLKAPDGEEDQKLDLAGAALATLALGGIIFGLIEAPAEGWGNPRVVAAFVIGAVALIALVLVEHRAASPMIPPQLFRSPIFVAANGLTLFLYAGLSGALFFLPFNLIQVQHYSPTAAGGALLPFVLTMLLLSRPAAALALRYGSKSLLVGGPLIAAAGFALLAIPSTGGSYWTSFFAGVLVLGIGMSLTVTPLTTVVMSSGDERSSGTMSGINNAVARTAGVMAIAVFGAVALFIFGSSVEGRLRKAGAPAAIRAAVSGERMKLAAVEPPSGSTPAEGRMVHQAVREGFIESFRAVMLLAAALAVVSSMVAGFTIPAKKKRGQ